MSLEGAHKNFKMHIKNMCSVDHFLSDKKKVETHLPNKFLNVQQKSHVTFSSTDHVIG